MLRVLAAVGAETAADVVAFLEASVAIAADVALVGSGIDQFAGHSGSPLKCLGSLGERTSESKGFKGGAGRARLRDLFQFCSKCVQFRRIFCGVRQN